MTTSYHEIASRWVARLRADDCSQSDREACNAWCAEHPAHASAFHIVSAVWQQSIHVLPVLPQSSSTPLPRTRPILTRRTFATGFLSGAIFLGMTSRSADAHVIRTSKGQQTGCSLAPHVSILLDSQSCVIACPEKLTADLQYGQIFLKVASKQKPFDTRAGDWVLRMQVAHVNVQSIGTTRTFTVLSGTSTLSHISTGQTHSLVAGQRITIGSDGTIALDRPSLDDLMAWRLGQLSFHDTLLRDAVTDMNRYASRPIVFSDPALGLLRISGLYHFGDNAAFAHVLEQLLPLRAIMGSTIVLVNV